jgi:adenosylcobyric acid synthase
LLPLTTRFEPTKLLRETNAQWGALHGPWSALAGLSFAGYEIRHGRTESRIHLPAALRNAEGEPIGWQQGSVLGAYAHGLFESPEMLRALFGTEVRSLAAVFDGLADFIDLHFQRGSLMSLLTP